MLNHADLFLDICCFASSVWVHPFLGIYSPDFIFSRKTSQVFPILKSVSFVFPFDHARALFPPKSVRILPSACALDSPLAFFALIAGQELDLGKHIKFPDPFRNLAWHPQP
mgnify:CR=1 FL=1